MAYESDRGDEAGKQYRITLAGIDAFLTATPTPEVQAEQGERQEAVAWRMWNGKTWRFCYSDCHAKRGWEPLYTNPQPGQDVRGLVEALEGMLEYFPEGNSDGECFSIEKAEKALAAHRQAQQGDSHDT